MRNFVEWYNHQHYHSGVAYLHPADVHTNITGPIIAARQHVLDAAYTAHPQRATHCAGTVDRGLDQQTTYPNNQMKTTGNNPLTSSALHPCGVLHQGR